MMPIKHENPDTAVFRAAARRSVGAALQAPESVLERIKRQPYIELTDRCGPDASTLTDNYDWAPLTGPLKGTGRTRTFIFTGGLYVPVPEKAYIYIDGAPIPAKTVEPGMILDGLGRMRGGTYGTFDDGWFYGAVLHQWRNGMFRATDFGARDKFIKLLHARYGRIDATGARQKCSLLERWLWGGLPPYWLLGTEEFRAGLVFGLADTHEHHIKDCFIIDIGKQGTAEITMLLCTLGIRPNFYRGKLAVPAGALREYYQYSEPVNERLAAMAHMRAHIPELKFRVRGIAEDGRRQVYVRGMKTLADGLIWEKVE